MTARKTQRQKDRELIAKAPVWEVTGFPVWPKSSLPLDEAGLYEVVLAAAARELNRIAREHRARRAK